MKTNKFFAVALAAMTLLASCAKEQPVKNSDAATVRLSIQGSDKNTRTLESIKFDGDELGVDLNDVTAFIIGSTNAVITKAYYTKSQLADSKTTPEIKTTTDASYVIVVANVGSDQTTSGKFATVANLADLQAVVFTLDQAVVLAGTSTVVNTTNATNRILLQGQSGKLTWSESNLASDDKSMLATTTVTLYPVPARLDVEVQNRMTASAPASWEGNYVKIESVSILYSAKNTFAVPTVSGNSANVWENYNYVVPADAAYNPYYLSGFNPASNDEWAILGGLTPQNAVATGTSLNLLNRNWNSGTPLASGSAFSAGTDFRGTFYALPGGAAYGAATTIAIVGTYDADGDGTEFEPQRYFWHVRMSEADAEYVLKNGGHYDVTITLSGDIKNGAGGTTDPDKEIIDAFVKVTITSAKWTPAITIDKVIG